MIRHDLIVICPAQMLRQETAALVSDALYTAAHDRNKGRLPRSRWLILSKCRPSGSHGSTLTVDLASPCSNADPKSP